MAALEAAIQDRLSAIIMDGRVKPGHDHLAKRTSLISHGQRMRLLRASSSRPSEARAGIAKRWALQFVTIPDKAAPFRGGGEAIRWRVGQLGFIW